MKNSFKKHIIPPNEASRIKALQFYDVLKNLSNRYFNNLARIIATTFNTSIALISIVADEKVFFKGNVGMPGINTMDRGISLCSLAILESEPTIFNDTLEEPCLLSNPLVAGEFGLRFYAGAPIITPEGFHIGTVCIVDKQAREFSENEKQLLVHFAECVMSEIENRKSHQFVLIEG